jgi:outer membrane protein insertion porin family
VNNLFDIGGDSLRGFAVGGIGPRDAYTADALGGQYYYTGSAELSYPLPFIPKEVALFGKAFIDVGSLWGVQSATSNNTSVLSSNLMRISPGIGIQWMSPFGPIRIDYAWPIQYESWDKQQSLRFGFGTRF